MSETRDIKKEELTEEMEDAIRRDWAILRFQREKCGWLCAQCFGTRTTPIDTMFNHGGLQYLDDGLNEKQSEMMWRLIDEKEYAIKDELDAYVGYIICEECLIDIVKKVHPHGEALVEYQFNDEHGWTSWEAYLEGFSEETQNFFHNIVCTI